LVRRNFGGEEIVRPKKEERIRLMKLDVKQKLKEHYAFNVLKNKQVVWQGTVQSLVNCTYYFFSAAQQPPVGHSALIVVASRSHSDTPHSVGLLWTSDQPDAETST
jgi:hypothetical protein